MATVIFLKGGPGSGDHGHKGRPGQRGGSAKRPTLTLKNPPAQKEQPAPASAPERSADIKTSREARAYWEKHFTPGEPRIVKTRVGTGFFQFHVTFARNHAFTDDSKGTGLDQYRTFNLERARLMDKIMPCLEAPSHVYWSETKYPNKAFDKEFRADAAIGGRFVRVVLEPVATPEDISLGKVRHFNFVSCHPINQAKFEAAAGNARNTKVTPTQIHKSLGVAPLERSLSEDQGARPSAEGVPFDWEACFHTAHKTEPTSGSGGDAGSRPRDVDRPTTLLVKAIQAGEQGDRVN
jgi:hypothetical protein